MSERRCPICPDCGGNLEPQEGPVLVQIQKHPTSHSAAKQTVVRFALFPDVCPHCGLAFDLDLGPVANFGGAL